MTTGWAARPVWQRVAAAWALGALSTAALPPLHLIPVLLISFPAVAALVVLAPSLRQAALMGWAFFFGQFAAGLYWIGYSFQVDADTYGAIAIPAVGGLTAALGLFGALWAAVLWFICQKTQPLNRSFWIAPVAAAAFCLMEVLRALILTGFPWNLLATVWSAWPVMLQSAAWWGAYGLSFFTVLAATAPVVFLLPSDTSERHLWLAASSPIGALGILAGLGAVLLEPPAPSETAVRVVQPNVAQKDKWAPGLRTSHFENLLALSSQPGTKNIVVWPETAVPFPVLEVRSVEQALQTVAPPEGALVTGFVRREGRPGQSDYRVFNSLAVITQQDGVIDIFDKAHLVPFGEYMPFRSLIPIDQLTGGGTDFSPGPGLMTLTVPGGPPASPLICYEIIFPGAVVPNDGPRPGWLLNITNDAWFGVSSGPHQHLASAQLRAVEEGLPVVRSANTGISAIIGPQGRVLYSLALETRGVIDAALPAARQPTPFSRTGIWPVALAIILGLAVAGILTRRKG